MTTIKARYADGVLTPIEPLDLADGCEVTVSIEAVDEEPPLGGVEAVVEMALKAHAAAPPDVEDRLPTDFVRNRKHYLYGYPKEDE